MDTQVIKKVSSSVYNRFPEFKGCRPTISKQKKPQAKSTPTKATYLLTYKTKALVLTSSGSKSLPRSVRVVATENGKILKMTTSR